MIVISLQVMCNNHIYDPTGTYQLCSARYIWKNICHIWKSKHEIELGIAINHLYWSHIIYLCTYISPGNTQFKHVCYRGVMTCHELIYDQRYEHTNDAPRISRWSTLQTHHRHVPNQSMINAIKEESSGAKQSCWQYYFLIIMTSSNRNRFRVSGPLCGEITDHWWIPRTKASDTEL